jgi:small subunit ribosomal protein S9
MVKQTAKYFEAVGRRKSSVARVRLYVGEAVSVGNLKIKKGEIILNNQPIGKYFTGPGDNVKYLAPLDATGNLDRFAISARVSGGGKSGQLDALVHGISRAIEKVDRDAFRPTLKKEGFLTRDPRIRERRKVGTGGRARRKKQSPKR